MRLLAKLVCVYAVGILAASATPQWPAPQSPGWTTPATITNVVDGDTVDVEIKRVVRIRLLQCWAPESRSTDPAVKKLGLASKANLQKLAPPGTPVVCHFPALGGEKLSESLSLDRVLGHVWPVDSKASLSQQQVEGGFAKADDPRGRH